MTSEGTMEYSLKAVEYCATIFELQIDVRVGGDVGEVGVLKLWFAVHVQKEAPF
jgi:hypothetical protein